MPPPSHQTYTCEECQVTFKGKPSRPRKYCSMTCRDQAHYKLGCVFQVGDTLGGWTVKADLGLKVSNREARNRHFWQLECKNCGAMLEKTTTEVAKQAKFRCRKCRFQPRGENGFQGVLTEYKRGAADRGLDFTLTEKEFRRLTQGRCHFCGQKPQAKRGHAKWAAFEYNGIDRFDNDIGYVPGNCVSCCALCNRMKMDMNPVMFFAHVMQIAAWHREGRDSGEQLPVVKFRIRVPEPPTGVAEELEGGDGGGPQNAAAGRKIVKADEVAPVTADIQNAPRRVADVIASLEPKRSGAA